MNFNVCYFINLNQNLKKFNIEKNYFIFKKILLIKSQILIKLNFLSYFFGRIIFKLNDKIYYFNFFKPIILDYFQAKKLLFKVCVLSLKYNNF